ncbi:Fusaric acid resistance protein-like-domain-containing protein [Pseudoneurospora amorphoporcata]|uniref:Fusaric acid resistance protein-like-domain-containing protein n=1 Tax=Pseudoneurospora amorphoporcata TaxID=241081 RepID=A0AAN6SHU9_9PEZI|nr:Fusaric acid resistance protein-like-domain-containing protein [Pseudoneurospora amorphoporcata]
MSSPSPSNNIPPYPQGPPAGRRASKRSKLRVGTFIEPSTGERSRRTFTLRLPLRRRSVQASPNGNGRSANTAIIPVFSDQERSISERSRAAAHNLRAGVVRGFKWLNSPTGRGVLKCTLAYTIASLATFLAPVSDFLGKPDGKHVVATITVYFHPARSAGSMIEAILIAIVAVAYAQVVSILSMCTSALFGAVWGNPVLAHILVLVVFIGGGFGFIGWLKQRMNNPLVNVGSTLASLAIIGVVTKETAVLTSVFSNQKIIQILKMLVMGITITTLVNLLVWRVSAVHLLRESMTQTSTALGDMLAMITHGFLSGAEDELLSREFNTASAAYKSAYPQLTKNLREAKFERYFLGQEKIYQLDRAVVKSMETLAQSIGGLRSAAKTQFALLKESFEQADQPPLSPRMQRTASTILKSGKDRSLVLQAIREASDEGDDDRVLPGNRRRSDVSIAPSFRNSGEIFELFIALLGPPMKSLAYTLSEVLRYPPFGSAPKYEILINDQFRQSLTDALGLFNDARTKALHELYKYLEMDRTRSEQIQADFEEVAAACGHFSFSLQSFAEEMQKYLDVLDDLKYESQFKRRSWHWLVWWRSKDHHSRFFPALPYNQVPEEQEGLIKPIKKTAIPKGIPDSMVQRRDTYNWEAAKDQSSRVVATLSQNLLRLMRRLARDDVRFGLKVGIGAILWAMFAFIPQTRDVYQHWRGEWGFLSFMIVCSMTVGAANTTGWARFLGTMIGAGAAYVNWNVTQGNALGLIVLGWLMAFWSFWMMIARGQAPLGRITLLAYNVSTLYAYSLSQKVDDDDDDEGGSHPIIGDIVRHRFIAVTAGILWGLIVCRLIWPISARKKFQQGLSMLYLQMGLIWKRGPLAILLRSDCSRSYLKSGEMTALKKYTARLDALRVSAASEFQLRGPFPAAQAGRLMHCASRLLDAFYAMSLVTQRRGHLTEGERALLLYTAEERKALCDRICHVFQVLASSLMLEYPLTDAIPSVMGQRDKLLAKIFQFRKEHMPSRTLQTLDRDRDPSSPTTAAAGRANSYVTAASSLSFGPSFGQNTGNGSWNNSLRGSVDSLVDSASNNPLAHVTVEDRDYALIYAYALVTWQVAEELSEVAREIEGLFGVLDKESILLQ